MVTRAQVTAGELAVDLKVYAVDEPARPCSPNATRAAPTTRAIFAHQASDEIMALAQHRGVARTKIAFVSDRDATKDTRGARSCTSWTTTASTRGA